MNIAGRVWKSRKDKFWLAEIPFLDLMIQAKSKDKVPEMVKDAIELLVDDPTFIVYVSLEDNTLLIDAHDTKKIIALILKRQRQKTNRSSINALYFLTINFLYILVFRLPSVS